MKSSILMLSIILTITLFSPFIYFMLKGLKNKSGAKKHISDLLKDNGIVYAQKEFWRNNFIGISSDKKILTYISFNEEKPIVLNISLGDLKNANIIRSNENDKAAGLKNLALEFVFKTSGKPHVSINFFNIDAHLMEDFEMKRIETWQALIKNAITVPQQVKIAS